MSTSANRKHSREAYQLAKANNGAPGVDGVTFEAIEASGLDGFLEQIRHELATRTYRPMRLRHQTIPKEGGKGVRVLSIPTIRDRVVQGAFKLILEPIFEADFQPGSYGYRPKRSAHDAVLRVAEAIVKYKTRVIDVDLQAYFDKPTVSPAKNSLVYFISMAYIDHPVWRSHREEAKRGAPSGPRITRNGAAMVSLLLPYATTGVSLIPGSSLIGATPRGQPRTPVLCTFRRPFMGRPVPRQLLRNALLDLTTIVPTTAYHRRSYAERYSRYNV